MMRLVSKWVLALSFCLAAQAFVSSARADQVFLLSDLISGTDVTIGDKVFSDFSFASAALDSQGNLIAGANPSLIFATFEDPVNGTYNVLFHSASQFSVGATVAEQDSILSFTASTTNGLPLITGVDLSMGGKQGNGTIDIIEGVSFNGPPPGITSLSVGDSAGRLFDETGITPSSSVFVNKNIAIIGGTSDVTKFTDFNQSFQQSTPEPASCVLMGVGVLFVAAAWGRKSGNAV
jgi:hypothetical protein